TFIATATLIDTVRRTPHGAVRVWTSKVPSSVRASLNSPTPWKSYASPSNVRRGGSPTGWPSPPDGMTVVVVEPVRSVVLVVELHTESNDDALTPLPQIVMHWPWSHACPPVH